jgi:hypothetical protein
MRLLIRIKFYAKWKDFIKEQAVDPDQPKYLTRFVYPILVPVGSGWVKILVDAIGSALAAIEFMTRRIDLE